MVYLFIVQNIELFFVNGYLELEFKTVEKSLFFNFSNMTTSDIGDGSFDILLETLQKKGLKISEIN